ncbi:MAG: GtrA family protein [Firmicutes bacterium]|nr:GtrA family protein [Bacillota bacterium]
MIKKGKLIIEGHEKNPFIKFWNWGWGIYYKNPEVWNYLIVGVLTTIVYVLVKNMLLVTLFDRNDKAEVQIAVFISWLAAVLFAYYPNRRFVFESKSKEYVKEFFMFILGRLSTYVLDVIITYTFQSIFGLIGVALVIYNIVDQIVVMVGNYVISKLFVFKNKKD